ncbi:MAG: CYTH domain-containing protein [bacterium]
MQEIEVKFLDIDESAMEAKLVAIGAVKQFERLYRRKVYDYPDLRLNEASAWIRVRDEGDKVTMGFKQRLEPDKNGNDAGMDEVEMTVSDFDAAWTFLEKIGMKQKFYEENRRTCYTLGEIEFDIDHWPLLKPYLEIEATTWEQVDEAIGLLGLDPNDKKICSAFQVYEMNGIDELSFDLLTFEKQIKKQAV